MKRVLVRIPINLRKNVSTEELRPVLQTWCLNSPSLYLTKSRSVCFFERNPISWVLANELDTIELRTADVFLNLYAADEKQNKLSRCVGWVSNKLHGAEYFFGSCKSIIGSNSKFVCNPSLNYLIHKSPTLDCVLKHMTPVHTHIL